MLYFNLLNRNTSKSNIKVAEENSTDQLPELAEEVRDLVFSPPDLTPDILTHHTSHPSPPSYFNAKESRNDLVKYRVNCLSNVTFNKERKKQAQPHPSPPSAHFNYHSDISVVSSYIYI